jgi:hypothetical protein
VLWLLSFESQPHAVGECDMFNYLPNCEFDMMDWTTV